MSIPEIVLERIDECQGPYNCQGSTFEITDADCMGTSRAAGISCFRTCFDGDTRIVGGSRYYEGTVEICRNNEWGVICDQGWNNVSAAVLCREQGFGAGGSVATFGLSSSRPVVTSNVTCTLQYNYQLSTCLNCTIIPQGCSSSTVAGVRCSPGVVAIGAIAQGMPEYGKPFSVQCFAIHHPFNATLSSYVWANSYGEITGDSRRSTRVIPSGLENYFYRTFFFNTSLDFTSLEVQDGGIYHCSMSLNITYPDGPDNSSAIIFNSTYFTLRLKVPSPAISFVTTPEPHQVGQRFDATCVVSTVEGLSSADVNIGWFSSEGEVSSSYRVIVGDIRVINSTFYSRNVSILQLDTLDSGTYICRASISGQFVYSEIGENTGELRVGGGVSPSCGEGSLSALDVNFDRVSAGALRILPGICLNGTVGRICSRGFDDNDAAVVCKGLGAFVNLTSSGGRAVNGTSSFLPVNLQDLDCSGFEPGIQECGFNRNIDDFCMNEQNTAAVECYFQVFSSCTEGEVFSLEVNTPSPNVIQTAPLVCVNGVPGGICSRGFDNQDATVVCRSLGNTFNISSSGLFISSGRVLRNSNFTGGVIRLQDLNCFGGESNVAACGYSTRVDEFCMDQLNAAAVECITEPIFPSCTEGEVFPTEIHSPSSNTIQTVPLVCVNGVPGGICSFGFDDQDATVVCRSLGDTLNISSSGLFISGGRVSTPNNFINITIRLQDLSCSGGESSLVSCGYNTLVEDFCMGRSSIAAVECIVEPAGVSGSGSGFGSGDQVFPVGPVLPFGVTAGDTVLPPGCNQYSPPIYLSPPFVFFGRSLSSLYINSDGYIAFEEIFTTCCNVYFPTPSPPLIAILWRGYNTSRFGRSDSVTYRLTRDEEVLSNISAAIESTGYDITPAYAVIATWYLVPTDNTSDSSLYTFQAILTSDGSRSFVAFAYGDVGGIQRAQVGFNLGDGYTYDNIISNRYLYSSVDVHTTSNVAVPGLHIFRVDNLGSPFSSTSTPSTSSPPIQQCYEGQIEISEINSTTTTTRNLETLTEYYLVPRVCVNGSLGYICDRGWDNNTARQICNRRANYPFDYEALSGVRVNSSFLPINYAIQDVNCSSYFYSIHSCSFNVADNSVCGIRGSSSIAGVVCRERLRSCYEGSIRLRNETYQYNGYTTVSGRVEVCHNGTYVAVCSGGLGELEAEIACRSHGYRAPFYESRVIELSDWPGDVLSSVECNTNLSGSFDYSTCERSTESCGSSSSVAGVVCTERLPSCYEGSIRLRNETYQYNGYTTVSGRVEVCHNGTYAAVCSGGLGDLEAEIACRSRGYRAPFYESRVIELSDLPGDVLSSVECNSNYSITSDYNDCERSTENCASSSSVAGVVCTEVVGRCYGNGNVRYTNINTISNSSGVFTTAHVEVCYNQTYGSICSKYVTEDAAQSVCQNRFSSPQAAVIPSPVPIHMRPPIVLERVDDCANIYDCNGATFGVTDLDCMDPSYALGISCSRVCFEGDTRITGPNYYEGVVEICRNNQWGVICDQGWNDISAAVLCQEKGFGAGSSTATMGLSSSLSVIVSNVTCNLRYNDALNTCLNCSIIPDECSSTTVAGVKCQPGVVLVDILQEGTLEYNSPFSLRCNGVHRPFNATLSGYQWSDANGPVMNTSSRTSRLLFAGVEYRYGPVLFNSTLDFLALSAQDAGIYNCSFSIEITYPDNSTAVISNTTYHTINLKVPTPIIYTEVTPGPQIVGQLFEFTCFSEVVEGLSADDVAISFEYGGDEIITNGRITISSIRYENGSLFSRTLRILQLVGSDTGNYTCRSIIRGQYVYSNEVISTKELVVEGVPQFATIPTVEILSPRNITVLEGSTVVLNVRINATPPVNVSDIQWFFNQFESDYSQDITSISLLGDNQTQIELDSDRISATLRNVSIRSSGRYTVVATNVAGLGKTSFYLEVQTFPQVSLAPTGPIIFNGITDTVTFVATCTANGIPTPTVSWLFEMDQIVSSSNVNIESSVVQNSVISQLTISSLELSEIGSSIVCAASNTVGNARDQQALYIAVASQPTISSSNLTPTRGDSTTVTCNSAPSRPQPQFIWSYHGVQLADNGRINITTSQGTTRFDLYEFSSTLTITSVNLSDSGEITCQVIQQHPDLEQQLSSSTVSIQINVRTPPEVLLAPLDPIILDDVTETFTLVANCSAMGIPQPVITWSSVTAGNENSIIDVSSNVNIDVSLIANRTVSTLTVLALNVTELNTIFVCSAINDVARNSVRQTLFIAVRSQPKISSPNPTPVVGETLTIVCVSTLSRPRPQFMWAQNGELLTSSDLITISTSSNEEEAGIYESTSTLTINVVDLSHSGNFTCATIQQDSQLDQPLQSSTDLLLVTVRTPPQVSLLPVQPIIISNIVTTFTLVSTCTAVGIPRSLITWTFGMSRNESNQLSSSSSINITTTYFDNMGTSVVTIQDLNIADRESYITCFADNSVMQNFAFHRLYIAVPGQPVITSPNSRPLEKNSLTVMCSSSLSLPQPVFRWIRDGVELRNSSFITILVDHNTVERGIYNSTSTLIVNPVELSDSGSYTCVILQDSPNLRAPLSSSSSLPVVVQFIDDCVTTNGEPRCQNGGECKDGDNQYFCICSGTFEGQNCEIDTSLRAPVITSIPNSVNASVGELIELSCVAEGVPTPAITWLFNNQPRSDLSSLPLIKIRATPENRGLYSCNAINSQGTASSAAAIIQINNIQQFSAMLAMNSGRRKRQIENNAFQEIVDSTVGASVGSNGITIYSAKITRLDGNRATVLYTLQRPDQVEFPANIGTALADTITRSSTTIMVEGIVRFDACSTETIGDYVWPLTELVPGSIEVKISCPCRSLGENDFQFTRARRVCGGDFVSGASWEVSNISACNFDVLTQRICDSSQEELLDVLESAGPPASPQAAEIIFDAVDDLLESSQNVTVETANGVGSVIDNLFDANLEEQNEIPYQSSIFDAIEMLGEFAADVINTSVSIVEDNFVLKAERVSSTSLTSETFSVQSGSPTVKFPDILRLSLPAEVPLSLATISSTKVGTGSLQASARISETILSVSISGIEISGLSEPIIMNFPENTGESNSVECVFWDSALRGNLGDWSDKGCTPMPRTGEQVTCACTHLSTFGVLYGNPLTSPSPTTAATPSTVEQRDTFEVSIIIYISLCISIFFLLLLMSTYAFSRKLREQTQIIFINATLVAFYISYIISSLAKQFNDQGVSGQRVCGFFSAVLEYFMFAYLLWTAMESIILILMAARKDSKSTPRFVIVISALICFILPLVIVAISLGGYQYFLSTTFCRPSNWPFYFGFIAPFVIIIMLDWALYVTTIFYIRSSSNRLKTDVQKYLQHYVFVAAILSVVFTIGWSFGLLGTADTSRSVHVSAQYIFSFMALIHSILTFIMHILRSRKAKENWLQFWYTITFRKQQYTINRTYTTAGEQTLHGTELLQSQLKEPLNPESANVDKKEASENLYSVEPVLSSEEGSTMAFEEVKVNFGREEDGEEEDYNRATAL